MAQRGALSVLVTTVLSLTVLTVSACGSGGSAGDGATRGGTSPANTAAPSGSAGSGASTGAAACDKSAWRSVPISSARQVTVPPVPVVTAVRTAQHPNCGYDRLVIDITGALPGYSIRYTSRVVADASGAPINLPGRQYVLITLRPVQAHTDAGSATVSGGVTLTNYPSLASWALAGDSEGVVTVAVGLAGPTSIRVGELPGHLYVDFKE